MKKEEKHSRNDGKTVKQHTFENELDEKIIEMEEKGRFLREDIELLEEVKGNWSTLNSHLERIKMKVEEFLWNKNVTHKSSS